MPETSTDPAPPRSRRGEEQPPPNKDGGGEEEARSRLSEAFRKAEHVLYVAVAAALALAGVVLFGQTLFEFGTDLVDRVPVSESLLSLLDGLLLVFIITELLHTVTAVVRTNVLATEPFLIVGIVAAIRRVVVATAEAGQTSGTVFDDLMLEIGVLFGGVVALGLTIFLLRHTERSEPVPAHEPGNQGAPEPG